MLKISPDNTIMLTRGDTARIQVTITSADGSIYTPVQTDQIRFAVKKRYTDAEPLILINIPVSTMLLEILPEHTSSLSFGTYRYDIQITMADGTIANDSVTLRGRLSNNESLAGQLATTGAIRGTLQPGSGTNDYERLINKPSINEVELIRDKSFSDLGLNALTNMELEALFN